MGLTILAIPFLILGVLLNPFNQGEQRCLAVKKGVADAWCFEQGSKMPEGIKYGAVAVGFLLIYAGRRQMNRRKGGGRDTP
jgi:hypothetical protein